MKTLLAASAVFVAFVAAAAVVVLPKAAPVAIDTRFAACIPAGLFEISSPVTEESKICITETMTEAVVTGQIADILPIMKEYERRIPLTCHRAAHVAGAAAWPDDNRWQKVIDNAAKVECSAGLLHGFIDRAANADFATEQWRELTTWCDGNYGSGNANCGDAIGHVAWETTKDRVGSSAICGMLTRDYWRSECAEGIVMQQYEPVSDAKQRKPLPDNPASVCEHLPRTGAVEHLRLGCIRGVGYVSAVALPALETQPAFITTADINIVARGLSLCSLFEDLYVQACTERFFDIFRFRFVPQNSQAAADLFCPLAGELVATCRERFSVAR